MISDDEDVFLKTQQIHYIQSWLRCKKRCTETSDPKHFGPKALLHHRNGSEVSGQFGTGTLRHCPYDTSAPVLHCLQSSHLF